MDLAPKHPFKLLYIVSFIFSFQYGLVVYVNSSFLELMVGEKFVGLAFAVASLLSILVLLEMPRILGRFGNYRTSIFFVLVSAVALALLGSIGSPVFILISFFLYAIGNYCLVFTRDVFVEEYTAMTSVGRTRGMLLTVINLALVLALSAAFLLVGIASYASVYLLAALLILVSLLFIHPRLRHFPDPAYRRISIQEILRKTSSDADLKKIYGVQFLLCFFYSWMIIYMPIYLHHHVGLPFEKIGFILTVMLVPFVLLDYPLGRLSDTIGEKKMLSFGFLIAGIATVSVFFLETQSVAIWALVLFSTRIGAATIEVMAESYFFKQIRPEDAGLISVFRNIHSFAFILAPLAATVTLFVIPSLRYLFLVLGAVILSGALVSLRLRDIR